MERVKAHCESFFEKKFKCKVSLSAEEEMTGEVYLTFNEYELVKKVTNPDNWENVDGGGYCGCFEIYGEEIEERVEFNKNIYGEKKERNLK